MPLVAGEVLERGFDQCFLDIAEPRANRNLKRVAAVGGGELRMTGVPFERIAELERVIGEDERTLDRVPELANVARPAVAARQILRSRGQPLPGSRGRVQPLEKMLGELQCILFAFAQWRELERKHGEPVVQVLAQL